MSAADLVVEPWHLALAHLQQLRTLAAQNEQHLQKQEQQQAAAVMAEMKVVSDTLGPSLERAAAERHPDAACGQVVNCKVSTALPQCSSSTAQRGTMGVP